MASSDVRLSKITGDDHLLELQYESGGVGISITETSISNYNTRIKVQTEGNVYNLGDSKILKEVSLSSI